MVLDLEFGDTLLLCTDGMFNAVPISRINELLTSPRTSSAICEQLISDANQGEGEDNITVVVTKFLREMSTENLINEQAAVSTSEADTGEFKLPLIGRSEEAQIAVATLATVADDRSQL